MTPAILRPPGAPAARGSGTEPIGLLAGSGRFPICFAEKARHVGLPVVCVGIRNEADPVLETMCDRFFWTGVARMGWTIRCFKRSGVRRVVMAGKVTKTKLYIPWRWLSLMPDWRTIKFWYSRRRPDNRDDTLLLGIIDEFATDGMTFESALDLCPELLVKHGVLTRRSPSSREERDIEFGWALAKAMGGLDVGQSVVVKERTALAVEAIEGTNEAILRAGHLCRAGEFVVVKVAKPHQDMRFDVPTVGCETIKAMHKAGGRVLAVEAGKTIILDQAETVALADTFGMTIIALAA